jgi:elongation factor Ts
MLEVNSETDFVARSEGFRKFAHEVALQIAAASPLYIGVEDIPEDVMEQERSIARNRALEEGKPEAVVDRIVEGRLEKFKQEVCLLRQPYIRDENITVENLLHQNIAAIGENIVIRRFVRWEVGEKTA